MNKFKTQNSYTGSKAFNNNPYQMQSISSLQLENLNIDEVVQMNLSQEEKNMLLLKYLKSWKLNTDTYPCERLLATGASPNCQDNDGKSPLMIAAEKGSLELVQLLLEENAEIRYRERSGKTALFFAIEANNENVDVVSVLLDNEADPNHEAQDRITPLLRSVEKGHYGITKILLEKGGNVHTAIESTGDTALHIAVRENNKKMVELLFEYGCDPNKRNKKKQIPQDNCSNNPDLSRFLQELCSSQKIYHSNIIKHAIETPSVHHTHKRAGSVEGKTSHIFNDFINPMDKDSNRAQNQFPFPHQQQRDMNMQGFIDQKKQKHPNQQFFDQQHQQFQRNNDKDNFKKHKGGSSSPNGVRRNDFILNSLQAPLGSENSPYQNNPNMSNKHRNEFPTFEFPTNTDPQRESHNRLVAPHSQFEDVSSTTSASQSTTNSDIHSAPGSVHRHHNIYFNEDDPSQQYHNQFQQVQSRKKNNTTIPNPPPGYDRSAEKDMTMNSPMHNVPGELMQYVSPQGSGNYRANFHPSQIKGNVPPPNNYYQQNQNAGPNPNPQFFNNTTNPNQNFQKKKGKNQGQGQNQPQSQNPGPNQGQGSFKNYPNNGYSPNINPNMNPSMNPNMNQNVNQNQYNRKVSITTPESNSIPMPNNPLSPTSNQANKLNKNQNRNIDKGPRGSYMNPNINQNPNMTMSNPQNASNIPASHSISHLPNEILPVMMSPLHGMDNYVMQENPKNIKDNKMPQGAIGFNNNMGINQFNNSPHMFNDMRNVNNMPPQSPYGQNVGNPQPHSINEAVVQMFKPQQNPPPVGNINPNMNGFGAPINFNVPHNHNQFPQMINKPHFVQGGASPYSSNAALDNSGIQSNVKVFHFDMNNQVQATNFKLNADYLSISKINKATNKDLDKAKVENKELKTFLETSKQSEQKLKKTLTEKDLLIEELTKKAEELEISIKSAAARSTVVNREDACIETDPLLTVFQPDTMDNMLRDAKITAEFMKHEYVSNILHEEITAFEKSVNNFNQDKKTLFDSLIESVKQAAAEAVPGAECEIYGSFATELCLPWSDIDVVIKAPQTSYGTTILDALEAGLKKKKWAEDVRTIRNTTVPVLKITCSKTYYSKKVDITMYDSRHNGMACVDLVREFLSVYPPLRSMVLILKQLLYRINLNDTYLGGLSSYGLILMIVFLFQTRELQRAMDPIDNQNLGSMLISFLYFYGFEYDYYTQFLVNPKKIPKNNDKGNDMVVDSFNLMNIFNQNPPTFMEPKIIIQDPISTNNNVGRSTFHIKEIKNAFMAAYFEAFKPCVCEIHKHMNEIDTVDLKKQHKCASLFKRMMFAYQPVKDRQLM